MYKTILVMAVHVFISQCIYIAPHTEYYIDSHLQVVDLGRCCVGKDGIFNRFRHLWERRGETGREGRDGDVYQMKGGGVEVWRCGGVKR